MPYRNYAVHRCAYEYRDVGRYTHGIKPDREVGEMPACLQALVARLVATGVVPKEVTPNTAIVNVYSPGDCIPPHGNALSSVFDF